MYYSVSVKRFFAETNVIILCFFHVEEVFTQECVDKKEKETVI